MGRFWGTMQEYSNLCRKNTVYHRIIQAFDQDTVQSAVFFDNG